MDAVQGAWVCCTAAGQGSVTKLPLVVYAHRLVLYACVGLPPQVIESLKATTPGSPDNLAKLQAEMKEWQAMHICDNKLCVNFRHLYWGKAEDNNKRSAEWYAHMIDVAAGKGYRHMDKDMRHLAVMRT